ncbi:hypothetical protein H0H81_008320 [Sphagnurus paluster]|uniref:Uncharacterized protein n=1 Tax=Sphagnurus paluster TaxID=117069 RepID=A0A9P7KIM5_9AGAR|nr:hypothetical protein H0H81_008320 [Sphagnurus paluster]
MLKRNISKSNLENLCSRNEQHTSTSEHVKTRPRKKRRITPAPVSLLNTTVRPTQIQAKLEASGPVVPPKSARKARANKARASKPKPEPTSPLLQLAPPPPPPTQPLLAALTPAHLHELAIVWSADKRTPSVASRRVWAHARGVRAEAVHRWWMRKRQAAKRDGAVLPDGMYDMRVGTPPVFVEAMEVKPVVPERRTRARAKAGRLKMELGVGEHVSSDTLVAFSSPPRTRSKMKAIIPKTDLSSPLPPSSPPPAHTLSFPLSSPIAKTIYSSSPPLPVTPTPKAWSPPKLFLRTPVRRYRSFRYTDTLSACTRGAKWCSKAPGAAFTCALCRSPPSSPCPPPGMYMQYLDTVTQAFPSFGCGE